MSPSATRQRLLAAARAELVERGHAAISLRAVARRAGLSHAAPKHHFHDRAGLLTAIATDGFAALTVQLRRVRGSSPEEHLARLGRSYIDFGLASPALFDLMFRPSELHPADPALQAAQAGALGVLGAAVSHLAPADPMSRDVPALALISWALVHGLVTLSRNGALRPAVGSGADDADDAELARRLGDLFSAYLAQALTREPPPPAP